MLFGRKDPGMGKEPVANHLPAHGAGSDLHQRIVANSLHLAMVLRVMM